MSFLTISPSTRPSQEVRETGKAEVEDEKKDLEGEKPKPEIVKKLADDWDEEEEEEQEKRRAEEGAEQAGGGLIKLVESKISFCKSSFLSSTFTEGDEKTVEVSKKTPASNPSGVPEANSSEPAKEKSEDVDEDQIVADVDDILNDTEDLMGDLDSIASGKNLKRKYSEMAKEPLVVGELVKSGKEEEEGEEVIKTLADKTIPTVQCEECYECFETEEKMTWHSLNDH